MSKPEPTEQEHEALVRLLRVARKDTGQSRKCAAFLLAWWNAEACGGFDITDLWGVDADLAKDMVTVFTMISRMQSYPDTLGYGDLFLEVVKQWRPNQLNQ